VCELPTRLAARLLSEPSGLRRPYEPAAIAFNVGVGKGELRIESLPFFVLAFQMVYSGYDACISLDADLEIRKLHRLVNRFVLLQCGIILSLGV